MSSNISGGLFPKRKPTGTWWQDHSLSLIIGAILLALLSKWFYERGSDE